MSTIAERVAAGAAFLDEHEPGWVDRIDLDRLDLDLCPDCIIGQLYGPEYYAGLRTLGITGSGTDRGFWPLGTGGNAASDLTAEWTRVITERRAAA